MSAQPNTMSVTAGRSEAHPLRAISFGDPAVAIDRRDDGTIYLRPKLALGDYPVRLTDRLHHWADAAPNHIFMAERDASGGWRQITYGQLLKVFFSTAHDPTTLNRQGPDYGRQYRSAVFYVDAEQKRVTDAYIKQLTDAGSFKKQIVTQVAELKMFYPAEDYHQDFVKLNPRHGYVVVNALPKIEKTRKEFPNLVHK